MPDYDFEYSLVFKVLKVLIDMSRTRSLVIFLGLLLLFACLFSLVENRNSIDALYFCVVTASSIGFGDIVPTTSAGKAISIVLAFCGMGLFADIVAGVGVVTTSRGKLRIILNYLMCALVGNIGFSLIEGWSFWNTFYFTVVMSTTIGYGDLTPQTSGGKLFCIFYAVISMHCTAELIGLVRDLYHSFDTTAITLVKKDN